VSGSSQIWAQIVSTTFDEGATNAALAGSKPGPTSNSATWSDVNSDWNYGAGGIVSVRADQVYPALINVGTSNYTATFSATTYGTIAILRWAGLSDYVYVVNQSWGFQLNAIVGGNFNNICNLFPSGTTPMTFTVTLDGSNATLSAGGQSTSGTLTADSAAANATSVGFFSPSAGFTMSGLVVDSLTTGTIGTTTTLGASSLTPLAGNSVTLTATVSPSSGSGTPTGAMAFTDGGNPLGSGTLSNGVATYLVSSIAAGSHNYQASYGGDNSYGSSSSALTVTGAATVLSTPNTNPTVNTPITLTATVYPSTATGTVTFSNGSTILGNSSLSGGAATYQTSSTTATSASYTAAYSSYPTSNAVSVTWNVSGGGGSNVTTSGGTTYAIPVFTGSSAIGNSVITQSSASNIGINTMSPQVKLDVAGGAANFTAGTEDEFHLTRPLNGGVSWPQLAAFQLGTYNTSGACCGPQSRLDINLKAAGNNTLTGDTNVMTLQSNGNVGIGTTAPGATLEVNGNTKLDGNVTLSGTGASITFPNGVSQTVPWTGVLGGGDYAESVNVSDDRARYGPGDVLVIDTASEGNFLRSAQPYSTSVTGIYSTNPGVVGRRQTTDRSHMPEEVPMAMTGIVPTKVSAENGPIKAGDLLVTSSRPGYAMKGTDHGRMLGAVIGKALGHLDSGLGVIEVVVTLQ
jgi:hypothetical protein